MLLVSGEVRHERIDSLLERERRDRIKHVVVRPFLKYFSQLAQFPDKE